VIGENEKVGTLNNDKKRVIEVEVLMEERTFCSAYL
jgi:hypothetical protein